MPNIWGRQRQPAGVLEDPELRAQLMEGIARQIRSGHLNTQEIDSAQGNRGGPSVFDAVEQPRSDWDQDSPEFVAEAFGDPLPDPRDPPAPSPTPGKQRRFYQVWKRMRDGSLKAVDSKVWYE